MIPESQDDLVAAFGALPTACVSDAMDRLGLLGSAHGLSPLRDDMTVVGRAYTVRYSPVGAGGGNVGDFLDDVPPGGVVAIANNGRTDCTVWGDIMTATAINRGIAGTVIDGVCRDVAFALSRKYPLYTRGRFMRTGKDRVSVAELGGVITVGDVQVAAGDIILGNADGIVVIASARAEEILALSQDIEQIENQILAEVNQGIPLSVARQRHGYHSLQSKKQ